MNFRGRLKLLPGQQKRASLVPPPLALFAIATPLQPLSILELRTKTLMFQTKHKLDFTPTACDSRYGISHLCHGKTWPLSDPGAMECLCRVLCPQGEGHPGLHGDGAVSEGVRVPVCARR